MTSRSKQNTYVVITAVAIVLASVLATVAFNMGALPGVEGGEGQYQNVTFTDATLSCEKQVDDQFGRQDFQRVFDSHSSRFDHTVSRYKIFFKVYVKKNTKITEYYITCIVRSRDGGIDDFEFLENKEAPQGEVIKKYSDKFIEWPK